MTQRPQAKYLKDYQTPCFEIVSLNLIFDLWDSHTEVTAISQIKRLKPHQSQPPLILSGDELQVSSLMIDGHPWSKFSFSPDKKELILEDTPNEFTLTLVTNLDPAENTKLSGLYLSGGNYSTQCEAEGFRRITYFLDRPDVMSIYTTKIIADKDLFPVLLSNGNKIQSGDLENNRHYAVWHDPFKKPSYLFALVAGNLGCLKDQFVTMGGREVNLEIYVPVKDLPRAHHAMKSLKESMTWDEKTFGREYDLNIYMIVAVPDFNMGAMENKGLNIFNTKYVLADQRTATDTDYQQIQSIIGHEYFHNWTGNRITCRDWFQLSLKEGLTVFRDQEFTSDMHSRAVKRIQDVKIIRSAQFAEDASPMAHPVRPDSYIEMNNFYTVTVYNKGAELIRMMKTIAGEQGFARGMEVYFERFDGMAVTCDDYRQAIAEGAGVDLDQFSLWYSQAGTPELKIEDLYDSVLQQYVLKISQHCPKTPGQNHKLPFHIPIKTALLHPDGHVMATVFEGKSQTEHLLHLKKTTDIFVFENVPEKPIPSLLRDFSAPVKLYYPYTPAMLGFLFSHDDNPFNRWDAGQKLATHCIDQMIAALLDADPITIDPSYISAIKKTLQDARLEHALISEALLLPSEATIGESMEIILVDEIHTARQTLLSHLSIHLRETLLKIYYSFQSVSDIDGSSIGKRSLKNTCLSLLMITPTPEILKLCQNQFEHAINMTDQMAALIALSQHEDPLVREPALDSFYQAWSEDHTIICKWFQVQALSRHANAKKIELLIQHEAFDLKNPNKIYALLVSFCQNMKAFHDSSGEGYFLIANLVKKLDPINPQVASRLARGLMNFRRYDQNRQALMRRALESILSEKLSQDVFEIVSKSLD